MARLTRGCGPLLSAAAGLFATACPGAPKDSPPPAESYEIASAAPHALGALAGGTEAAPRAVTTPAGPRPLPDETAPDPEDEEDGGALPAPDAGAASGEDLPL
jgi:hypothetical protein